VTRIGGESEDDAADAETNDHIQRTTISACGSRNFSTLILFVDGEHVNQGRNSFGIISPPAEFQLSTLNQQLTCGVGLESVKIFC